MKKIFVLAFMLILSVSVFASAPKVDISGTWFVDSCELASGKFDDLVKAYVLNSDLTMKIISVANNERITIESGYYTYNESKAYLNGSKDYVSIYDYTLSDNELVLRNKKRTILLKKVN